MSIVAIASDFYFKSVYSAPYVMKTNITVIQQVAVYDQLSDSKKILVLFGTKTLRTTVFWSKMVVDRTVDETTGPDISELADR